MRILVYKRTHNGDPDHNGCFGAHDCMGAVRALNYDAVIGIGGVGAEARSWGIDGKVNWIGIGPQKTYAPGNRGPQVTFDHFLDFGTRGPAFPTLAPTLAERVYSRNVRYVLHLAGQEYAEACAVVKVAEDAAPSRPREKLQSFSTQVHSGDGPGESEEGSQCHLSSACGESIKA